MIDFRYHLVSLIAVFLALALGILLGAGPLNQPIGDQLTGQVEDLREDRDRLRTELDVSQTEVTNRDSFIDDNAAAILGSRLEARTVAIITLPEAVTDDVAAIRQRLEQAGAVVTGEIAVTEAWTDPDTAAFRSSFAGQLLGYLEPAPEDDAAPGVILGTALGQGLTRGDAEGAFTTNAETLLELLSSADNPLVEVVEEPSVAANATVVVGPRGHAPGADGAEEGAEDVAEDEDRLAIEVALAQGLASTGEGAVVSGSSATERDLVTVIRATAPEAVTTVDSVGEVPGQVNVPLALAAAISGTVDHYGFGADASTQVPPSVYLAPPALPGTEPGPGTEPESETEPESTEDAA
ncbi:copper transporter [Georgenia sunbinii]|uniref:copper transporter n=1 Tax=Georgenia sunbinii TaxID=3117728 RepID=UPI002F25F7A3